MRGLCPSASKRLPAVTLLAVIFFMFSFSRPSSAQQRAALLDAAPRSLITQPVDEQQLTILKGNTHPLARPEFDLGTAPATLPMQRMLLVLKRSPEQESALRQLLDNQQDKSSPSYHKWLTPEDYGRQFGPTDADLRTITAWLQSHGFEVAAAKGRTTLEFSGSASQVQEAFHTTIHKYLVNGEQHSANSSDPQIPAALTSAVAGVASLNNFPRHSMVVSAGKFKRDRTTGKITAIDPQFTFPSGCVENNSSNNPCFYGIGPYDFATIYNVQPLWNAGINGTGQTIAIVGETNINIQDVRDFRSLFGLPVNDPQIILNGPDPGIRGDETEADLDVQWSGAVAPNATIDLVVSQSTETTAGIDLSAVYIIDNNLAAVMSESYGQCELGLGTTGNQFYNALWQQAAAQGITVFISAGDNGAAGCDNFDAASPAPAQFGLQVSGYASTPYNVAVGGTDFNDFSNPATYWNTTNNSTTQASAKSYIPETTWNSSCTNAIFATVGFSTNPETNCNDSRLIPHFDTPLGGSGGASNCTTPSGSTSSSCAGGYPKPSWQTGTGVPNDGKRDIPDVSLFASNGFLQNFYILCESDVAGPCGLNFPYSNFLGVGGTSASSPAFAGIMALVNQQMASQGLSPRQGNANYVLYKLATQQPTAFHDVTSGTIAMPCLKGSPNCSTTNPADQYGVMTGYNAGIGYDRATGLGSVDAQNLVNKWSSVVSLASTTTLNSLTPTTITHGQPVNFNVTVAPKTGSGTPTGTVSLLGGPTTNTQGIAGFNLSSGTFSGSTDLLPGGTYSVTAHYPGDGTYEPSDSTPVSVTVNKENSQPQVFLVTFDFNGNVVSSNTNTAVYGSSYVLRVNVENSAGAVCTPVSTTAATGCPSGTVTMTDNGATLDAGTYTLNSYGYFEDLAVQLPGGTNSVKASYAGDNSFNASAATQTITISPAPTTSTLTSNAFSATVGVSINLYAMIQAESFGTAPTGTVAFLDNGNPLVGTVTYQTLDPCGNSFYVCLNATLVATLTTAGTHTITSNYASDNNYTPTSASLSLPARYSPTATLNASAQSVPFGTPVTLTALFDSPAKNVPFTGGVNFVTEIGPAITGTVTLTPTTDGNGNSALQAVVTFTPYASVDPFAAFLGDTNYVPISSNVVFITVTGNDFNFSPGSTTVNIAAPGQSGTLSLNIVGPSTYTGTVNFNAASCAGLPAESSCSFSQPSITGSGATNLTISTMAPHQTALSRSSRTWTFALAVPMAGLMLISFRRRSPQFLLLAAVVVLLTFVPSCGGGGGSSRGGVTDPGTPAGTHLVTVTATSGSGGTAITHTLTFNLVVNP